MANRSIFQGTHISCGVQQLSGLDDSPEYTLRSAFRPYPLGRVAHVVFSDAFESYGRKRTCNGINLAKFIVDNELGTVVRSPGKRNPNSSNRIVVWIWTLNVRALRTWLEKERREA